MPGERLGGERMKYRVFSHIEIFLDYRPTSVPFFSTIFLFRIERSFEESPLGPSKIGQADLEWLINCLEIFSSSLSSPIPDRTLMLVPSLLVGNLSSSLVGNLSLGGIPRKGGLKCGTRIGFFKEGCLLTLPFALAEQLDSREPESEEDIINLLPDLIVDRWVRPLMNLDLGWVSISGDRRFGVMLLVVLLYLGFLVCFRVKFGSIVKIFLRMDLFAPMELG